MTLNKVRAPGILILFLLVSSGCAITTTQPINRFDLPETRGEQWHGYVEGGLQGGSQTTITSDYTAVPVNISPSYGRYDAEVRAAGGIDFTDFLELEAKVQADSPAIAILKFQILGAHQDTAKNGDFSLAVTAGGGANHTTGSGNNVPIFGGPTIDSNYSLDSATGDFAAIAGYRVADIALIYGGPFYEITHYSGSITQNTSPAVTTPFSGHNLTVGGNAGVAFFYRRFQFKFELAAGHSSNGTSATTGVYPGTTFAFAW